MFFHRWLCACAAFLLAIEVGSRALDNYLEGCDVLNIRNYNAYNVAAAAATGAFAPGWFSGGKKTINSARAASALTRQLGRTQTINRFNKISSRIEARKKEVASLLIPQLGFQGMKAIVKKATNMNESKECICKKLKKYGFIWRAAGCLVRVMSGC